MNRQDVNKEEFWKTRIENAKKAGKEQFSVYLANNALWKSIEVEHKKIIDQFVTGKVLDAGCGYGRLSEWIKDYTGVDFSPDFIERSKELYPGKRFLQANLKDLPFKDKEFDWVVCVSIRNMIRGYESVEAWDLMDKELKRVGKKILYLEYTSPGVYEIA